MGRDGERRGKYVARTRGWQGGLEKDERRKRVKEAEEGGRDG